MWARHDLTDEWFYTFDPQGCLSQKVSRTGAVMCSSIFDAGGHEATNDARPDPFSGFGGRWGYYSDWETSADGGGSCLSLLTHRFYDPNSGRFLTRDPAGYAGGVNLYAYCQNDPVSFADPNGYAPIIINNGSGPGIDNHGGTVTITVPPGTPITINNGSGAGVGNHGGTVTIIEPAPTPIPVPPIPTPGGGGFFGPGGVPGFAGTTTANGFGGAVGGVVAGGIIPILYPPHHFPTDNNPSGGTSPDSCPIMPGLPGPTQPSPCLPGMDCAGDPFGPGGHGFGGGRFHL